MPAHLILVHGEANNMSRLRSALKTKFAERKDDIQIYTPRNVETVKLKFRGERMAKVSRTTIPAQACKTLTCYRSQALGSLALTAPTPSSHLSGLLVSKDFTYTFLAPSDLRDFTGLSTSIIMQRQRLTVGVTWDLVRWHLRGMYGKIEEGRDAEGTPTMRVMQAVDIKAAGKFELAIEWVGSVTNDMVADSVIALVLGVDGSPASVKSASRFSCPPEYRSLTLFCTAETSSGPGSHCSHRHPHAEPSPPPADLPKADGADGTTSTPKEEADPSTLLPSRLDRLIAFLDSYFGQVELIRPEDVEASPSPAPSLPPAAAGMEVDAGAAVDPSPLEPAEKAEQELAEAAEEEQTKERLKKEERIRQPRVPVIRVRLDDYVADVVVESLVSTFFLSFFPQPELTPPSFAERHFDPRASSTPRRVSHPTRSRHRNPSERRGDQLHPRRCGEGKEGQDDRGADSGG